MFYFPGPLGWQPHSHGSMGWPGSISLLASHNGGSYELESYANTCPGWSHEPLILPVAHPLKSRWRQSYPHGSAGHSPFHSSLQGPWPQGMGRGILAHLNRTRGPTPLKPYAPPPHILAPWACDRNGSLDGFWTMFHVILLLSGRIAPSFHWVGWPILISLLNHHLAILLVFSFFAI